MHKRRWIIGLATLLLVLVSCQGGAAASPLEEEVEPVVEVETEQLPVEEAEESETTEAVEEEAPKGKSTVERGDYAECAVIVGNAAAVRLGPDSSSELLGYLPVDLALEVLSVDNDEWLKIEPPESYENYPDLWVWAGATEPGPCDSAVEPETETVTAGAGECMTPVAGGAQVRLGANSGADALGFLLEGEAVQVESVDDQGWVKIVPPDKFENYPDLYVWNEDLEPGPCDEAATSEAESATAGECMTPVAGGAQVRLGANSGADALGFLLEGEVVQVESVDDQGWVKIVPPDKFKNYPDLYVWNENLEPASCP